MKETVKKALTGDFNRKKGLMFLITALLTVLVWNLPIDCFGIEGLTVVQQRIIAIFVIGIVGLLLELALVKLATAFTFEEVKA